MGRRRSAALQSVAGTHHVASRLALEGFRPTMAADGTAADVLVGLSGGTPAVSLAVRTTECPPGFGEEGATATCEWRVGKAATDDDPDLLVALVDLGRQGELPGVWVVPPGRVGGYVVRSGGSARYRLRASGEGLSEYRDGWDAIEEHLRRRQANRTGWFEREELEGIYGEGFVGALDAESSRLLDVGNPTLVRIADERFPAEDLADAQALLNVLFRRYMQEQRDRREEEYRLRNREERRGGAGT